MNEININGTLERMKMIERGVSFSILYPSDIYEIIYALNEKQERENPRPLTLKELLDMNGKPLWIAIKDSKVHVCEIRCVILSSIYTEIGFGYTIVKFTDGSLCYLEDYMEKWLAYCYKPEEVQA